MPLRSSELVGTVVGDRYRLLRPIGSGASAHVYVAEDVRLRRAVAVKVLHPALSEDKSFLRRFQAEAQTIAVLRHPGIVRVYDWGEDGQQAYLAMELLEGGSLRSLLDSGYRLSISQVAAVGLDVASALAYAHSRGLVHRDIKPANLLFDEEGHASVADFGIARALAEASWTEPVGAMVGTARYAAPEQLRGLPLDGRADVYALTLVLVEAATGSVPFALDTTLGGLIARAGRSVPVPAELGLLAPVLEQAGLADPEARLSAEALAQQISAVARQLRAPERLPLTGVNTSGDLENAGEHTELAVEGRRAAAPDLSILPDDPVVVVAPPRPAEALVLPRAELRLPGPGPTGPAPAGPGPTGPGPAGPGPTELAATEAPGRPRRRRRWLRFVVPMVLLVAAGAVAAELNASQPAPKYPVPWLVGDTVAGARTVLVAEHLGLSVAASQWDKAAKGSVISQDPPPNAKLLANTIVAVTVSLGPEPVRVPDLATLDVAQATRALRASGLHRGAVHDRTSMSVPAGVVISWTPHGKRVPPGTAVKLVVSTGKPMALVPAFAASTTFDQMVADLTRLRFHSSEVTTYSNTVPAGHVIGTQPLAGAREVVGTTVTVTVSLGPHLVTIPASVVGLSAQQAAKLLERIGLDVYETQGSPLNPVTGTQPAVGTSVLYGKSVVLVTG
ncbi:MAG TPA: PASTA domain-containing protein [Acidimicrobiales bacterium]|nr:PASTA domain-containing protein [Acidimicrobiales bacterium]